MEPLLDILSGADACLTLDELESATGLTYRQVCCRLRPLLRAGWASRADQGCYCLTPAGRDAWATQASLPPDVAIATAYATRTDSNRVRLWAAMRAAERFCRADLIQLAATDEADAARLDRAALAYMIPLREVGYLVRLQGTVRVKPNVRGQARWRLAWDTGPLEPRFQKTGGRRVFDPNRGRFYTSRSPVGPA